MDNSYQSRQATLSELIRNGETICGYFIQERRGLFSPVLAARFCAPETVKDMPEWMVRRGEVAPDSVEEWRGFCDALGGGAGSASAMVGLRSDDGGFGRYWLRADIIRDGQERPYFALISMDDFTGLSRRLRETDDAHRVLLNAVERTYPEVLSIDLTGGTYRVIRYDTDAVADLPETGALRDMVRIRGRAVLPEDRERYAAAFSPERMETAFVKNRESSLQLAYRRPGPDGGVYWMETTVVRQDPEPRGGVMLVSMTRNVDAQKAEEIRLREQVYLQAEELRVTAGQLNRTICYYDIPTKTLTVPPEYAREHCMPEVIHDYPENMDLAAAEYYPEVRETLRAFCDGMCRGDPTGSCEVPFKIPGKEGAVWKRMEHATVFDESGEPRRAVIFLDDITAQRTQALENERLRENEYLLRLTAQHSDRIVCHYDIKKQTSGVLDPYACAKCRLPRLCEMGAEAVLVDKSIPRESAEKLREMFSSIEAGESQGELRIQAIVEGGELRWFDIKWSTIYDEAGRPSSAILSHRDVTEAYEHELAYRRYVQSIEFDADGHLMYIESDLTADRVEKLAGQMMSMEERSVRCAHSDFGRLMLDLKFVYEDVEGAARYFSCENLLQQYTAGERQLKSEWQVRYSDDSIHWIDTDTTLMADPYNGHIKAFFRMMDVTEEKEGRLEIQRRSETDSMTGLYNRATAEDRTRRLMASREPGILILLDLDDLKGINDTFGHKEGDRAILGITETIRAHFRESDVLGRLGGDEFLVYLPGAAENTDSISVSLTSLLRKLSGIPIGEGGERRIHCSVGCAVQGPAAQTYEDLFKQADTALYHVKRSGKNNFAFYEPEMEQADYQFRAQKLLSQRGAKKFEIAEVQRLLDSIASLYPMVFSADLSNNNYYLMESSEDPRNFDDPIPTFGALDQLMELFLNAVHPDDRAGFSAALSRQALLETYTGDRKSVRHHYRYKFQDSYRWAESIVVVYISEQGDVCDFTMMRWADERARELELLWMQKVMELAVNVSFEYICLLDLSSGDYSLFGDEANTHHVPDHGDFDAVTRAIRDNSIRPSEREGYYEAAKLSTIAARMREEDGYSYRYAMRDGARQATFHWFEPTKTRVLMTVQRVDA